MSRTRNRYGNSYDAMVEAEYDEYNDETEEYVGPEDGDDDDPGNWED